MGNKWNKSSIIIIALLLVVIAIGGIATYTIVQGNKDISYEQESGLFSGIQQDPNLVLDVDGQTYQEMLTEMQKKVDDGRVEVKYQNEIIVESKSKIGKVNISNPGTNNYDTFITIFLDETQKKVCQTGLIPVGSMIEQVTLDEALSDGEYSGVMVYNMINEEKQVVGQANLGITIKVGTN